MFKEVRPGELISITTNGCLKKDGSAVMGAGVARVCRDKFCGIDKELGVKIQKSGNHVYILRSTPFYIVSFPTKYNWWDDSDIALIRQSIIELVELVNSLNIKKCYLPRPGCSNGHLNYKKEIQPILNEFLDERFIVCYL